ncbi:MAG: hypothetical protein V4712_00295 [Pseudomonadota bacterium]
MSHSPVSPPAGIRSYLVMVPETLVAQDIALTIADHDPAAEVIFAKSAPEAEKALGTVTALAVAFVADRPSLFVPSALASAIAARGGHVILLGIEAESTGPTPDFDVLYQPFDIDAVIAKLSARG